MKISIFLLVMMSIVSFSVYAAENVGADDNQLLLASCQALTMTPEQENANPCIHFIQGFLAAAQVIDLPIINKKTKESRKFYSFMSRPYRSMDPPPPARLLPFCVPDDESEARVIKIVSKQLSSHKTDMAKKLRDFIFKALKAEYPCKKA